MGKPRRIYPWFIYQLETPTGLVMYVGATTDPERRYDEHIRGYKQGKALKRWVQGLLSNGQRPHMHIIEQTDSRYWQQRERYWIATYRKNGKLLNKQVGGIVSRKPKKRRK